MPRRKTLDPPTPSTISTRSSARLSASSKSGTSTPATSLPDDTPNLAAQVKEVKAVARTSSKRIREQNVDSDDLDATDEKITTKKRVLSRSAFVELKRKNVSVAEATSSRTRNGDSKIRPSSPVSEVELLSDNELNYEESGSSGSEFRLSDEEDSYSKHREENLEDGFDLQGMSGDEAEAAMMSAAIQMSLQTSNRHASNGASSSRSAAAAAEKRRHLNNPPVPDEELSDWEHKHTDDDSEAELPSKGKGKGKGKKVSSSNPSVHTLAEIRERRKQAREDKFIRRKEEMALRRKLGRKLTHAERTTLSLYRHHSELKTVWGDLEENIPITVPIKDTQPAGLKLSLLPFQLESLYWMKKQEKGPWSGGMLADEMGMGKTIQTIALFVTDRQKPNLIVAPTVAVMQWKNEIEAHTDDFKVLLWHGANREQNVAELQKYDVILTSYAVLESCFRKQQSGFKRKGQIVKEKSIMHAIEWKRIILDEAHNIKERSTNTAKAAFELKSMYKWCLSGTPLQNRVGELYSLVRFLGGDPFSYYFCKNCPCKSLHWRFTDKRTCDDCGHSPTQHTCFWNNEILTPIQKNAMEGPGRLAFKKLKILLDRMMLRRTKIERADDLGLPPRTVTVRRDYFSEEEQELYLSLFSDAKRQFSTYVDSGTLLNNYSNIFSLITRMRQMACHPDLVLRSKRNAGKLSEDIAEAPVCRLCHDIAEDAVRSKCHHIFDRECMRQYLSAAVENTPACPVCHLPISVDLDAPAVEFDEDAKKTAANRQGILGRLDLDTWRSSTKIEALVEELTNLRRQDATTKSLVFSQFVNFLDLIAFRLQRAGFNICRLEGTMSPQARDATIKHFMNNVHVNVFLVSLKAGGVALNLTEASRVYLMDSWWNPAVEYQAMDRIHRLGQYRPVQAIKLVIEDSIESRIIQLQEKKKAMVDATLSTDDSAMGRLTPEDLGFLFRL